MLASIVYLFTGNLYITSFVVFLLSAIGIRDKLQKKHSIQRTYPIIGHFRWMAEDLRPKIQQYFVENDLNGKPYSHELRSIVYQRAKKAPDVIPFGTEHNLYDNDTEWLEHSLYPKVAEEIKGERFSIGNRFCKLPYSSSRINSSAMSYGALGDHAVRAINAGAKIAGFAQNTGEGGLTEYHFANKGDIIWQIGTGYFGARTLDGKFDINEFEKKAKNPLVKMIEIKLSQGAKPSHGGILPAEKVTPSIARIRGIEPYKACVSPPAHTAFNDAKSMMLFVNDLRIASGYRPIGIKMCLGNKEEVKELVRTMAEMDLYPDYFVVDGAEGGTGAAPFEFTNYVGTPLVDGIIFVSDLLKLYKLDKEIKLIASGKIVSGFDAVKILALGANGIEIARGMLFSLGCIQARVCHTGKCPTGITTTNNKYQKSLVVGDKAQRVANFHRNTIESIKELVGAMGLDDISDLKREHIYRRIAINKVESYEQLFPSLNQVKEKFLSVLS